MDFRSLRGHLAILLWTATVILTGCGGDGGSTPAYSISVTVAGLVTGASVVLQNNGGDSLTITANGTVGFNTPIKGGGSYAIAVLTQPIGEKCAVTAGSGKVSNSNINVAVNCTSISYSVGGNVSGLLLHESVVLQENGTSTTVSSNGSFSFGSQVPSGSSYAVTVTTQPLGEYCAVTGGSGTIAGSNITNVAVDCVAIQYPIAVNVVGLLPNSNLVLQDNGRDNLTVTRGGTFSFAQKISSGAAYSIQIASQPAGQTCATTGGNGMVAAAPVTVTVTCPWHILYTANFINNGAAVGVVGISGFAIDPTSGAIAALPTSLAITGHAFNTISAGLNHDSTGKHLYNSTVWGPNSSNVAEDDIYAFDVNSSTGALAGVGSPVAVSPASATVTSLLISPKDNFAYAQQTGSVLSISPTSGALTLTGTTAAWGTTSSPQGNPYGACAITPSGAFAYCTSAPNQNVLPEQGVVTQFGIDASTGAATPMNSVAAGAFPREIAITPNGNFAYVADGANIWEYAIDTNSGVLAPLATNPLVVPQSIEQIAVSPNGNGLYMLVTGALIGYAINPANGALTQVSGVIATPQGARGLTTDPSGKFIYALGGYSAPQIVCATIDATTGALIQVSGSPFDSAVPGVIYNGPAALDIVPVLP